MPVNWKDASTALSIASVLLAPLGVVLPNDYGKAVFAVSVGLANAAVIALKHGEAKENEVVVNG